MKLSENIDFKTRKNDEKSYVKHVRFCQFGKFSKQWFKGGISLKGLKMHLTIDQRTLTFFLGWSSKKSLLRSLMFSGFSRRFLHSFRSLHSLRVATSSATATPKGTPAFATDFASLRSLRSLHSFRKVSSKPEKSVILIRIFWRSPKKKVPSPWSLC